MKKKHMMLASIVSGALALVSLLASTGAVEKAASFPAAIPGQITDYYMSDSCTGAETTEFPSGTVMVYVIFDYTQMGDEEVRTRIYDNVGTILFEQTRSYMGSRTECIAALPEAGVFPDGRYLTNIYIGGYIAGSIIWQVGGAARSKHSIYLPLVAKNYSHRADTYEPNDLPSQAYGPLISGVTYRSCVWSADDNDWYYLDVTSLGLITIDLDVPADLYLYEEGSYEVAVASSDNYGDEVDEHIEYNINRAVKHYIRVYPYQGHSSVNPYLLVFTFSPAGSSLSDYKVYVPAIDAQDKFGTGRWETKIQAQNVGDVSSRFVLIGWRDYSALCSADAPGPAYRLCSEEIPAGVAMIWEAELPEDMRSAIIYSVAPESFPAAWEACADALGGTANWLAWQTSWAANWKGEPLAVAVSRSGLNDFGTTVSSAYIGMAEKMHENEPPYRYFAPYVMKGFHDLDTEMTIQNLGQQCISVRIDYQEFGTCQFAYAQHIQKLAPGEAVRLRVPSMLPCYWLGSASIEANAPLGIIVDEMSFPDPCGSADRGGLLTYRAEELSDVKIYGPLIFREISGWNCTASVQNLSSTDPTWVTVKFLDANGGTILSLSDWVCATGSEAFYLPVVDDVGFDYAGSVVIESREKEGQEAQPISAVVALRNWSTGQALDYNSIQQGLVENMRTIALPSLAKGWDLTSGIAIRNNSDCNRLAAILDIYDGSGLLTSELRLVDPEEVEYIHLANMGGVPPFVGSGMLRIGVDKVLCGEDVPGADVPMASALVVNGGTGAGDVTSGYEGIPLPGIVWPAP